MMTDSSNETSRTRDSGDSELVTFLRTVEGDTVCVHPQVVQWLKGRMARLRSQLISDRQDAITATEKAIALLRDLEQESNSGYVEKLISEFATTCQALKALDPENPVDLDRFSQVGKRLDLLGETISLLFDAHVLLAAEPKLPTQPTEDDQAQTTGVQTRLMSMNRMSFPRLKKAHANITAVKPTNSD